MHPAPTHLPPPLPDDRVAELATQVTGPVLRPGEDGYDAEHAGFNLAVEHHPVVVVGATGTADVLAAVRFAAAHDLPVAVQATGHGVSVPADGAVLISTRRMTGLRVDPDARTVRVEAGVRWAQVIHEAAAFGLAPLSGSSPDVGAVSYSLGGGLSLLARTYGYAADHVRQLDVVTPDGQFRHVSADHHPDLFWALRGGKGNFGVVTSMEIGLVPVARLYGGALIFDGRRSAEVLHAWRDWTRDLPEELTSSAAMIRVPEDPDVPEPLRGRLVATVRVTYTGPAAAGERLVQPLRDLGPRLLDTVAEMPYTQARTIHSDPTEPRAYRERPMMLRDLTHEAVDTLLELAGPDTGCPLAVVELRHLGGALSRRPRVPNAVGNRDAAFTLSTIAPAGQAGAAELLLERMTPWGTGGVYLNFLGGPATVEEVRAAYDPDAYARLAALKATYDPHNLFRVNHNIPPGEPA